MENNAITSQCPQNGRSMIEMLGVLAIIGVLSVGGIMGYSKAMMRYRVNKFISQVAYMVSSVQTAYINQQKPDSYSSKYLGLSNNKTLWKKARLAPEEMWQTDADGNITRLNHAFGGYADFYGGGPEGFTVNLQDLSAEACIELGTKDWTSITGNGLIAVCIDDGGGCAEDRERGCSGYQSNYILLGCVGGEISVPLPFERVVTACSACSTEGDYCELSMTYY